MIKSKETFKTRFTRTVHAMWGKEVDELQAGEIYRSLVGVIRETISENWIKTNKCYTQRQGKTIYYFSIEFLLGRFLEMNLVNLGIKKYCKDGLADLGIDLESILSEEPDAGLGNGGLGRLAACFIDSLAAMSMPGNGCGIRYRYGLFEQKIIDNYQVELPDNWLRDGFAWEYRKADKAVEVRLGGNAYMAEVDGGLKCVHEDYFKVHAVPYDVPIVGYGNNTVNTLRLWNAEIAQASDRDVLHYEQYCRHIQYKHAVQRITKILYPDDSSYDGRLLRLTQEYFFVSAGLQSIIKRYLKHGGLLAELPSKIAVHINDTHPAVAVAELMRILMDDEELGWEEAWDLTTHTIAYTNHTIMPEALEKWPIDMFKGHLPRIYLIIEEINRRLVEDIRSRYPANAEDKIRELAVLYGGQVHMARLAVVGSYSVNGVAAIHSEILKRHIMRDFNEYYPGKFNNKTNGITHRRWLIKANPELTELISSAISPRWQRKPEKLIELLKYKDDQAFKERLGRIKHRRKEILAKHIAAANKIAVDPDSIFDIQIKRIHSYKRQLLNILHVMDMYNRLKERPQLDLTPRTFIFGGKAAPSYRIAKLTIKLINSVAQIVNNDKQTNDRLKVVFIENYGVSLGEILFPAADVSEQISTASKEASGTGNMKFMMNGAITLGTLDGANVEIHNAVGDDNCVIFGLRADEVINYINNQTYSAWDVYSGDPRLQRVLDQLVNGFFDGDRESFSPLYDYLLHNNDEFFVLKDFASYADAQLTIERRYNDTSAWLTSSLVNIAHSGKFSSDRTIAEYAADIWDIKPIVV